MKFILIIVFLFIAGCTNQQMYDNIRTNKRNECTKEPSPSLQKKCEEKLIPYREYETQRQQL